MVFIQITVCRKLPLSLRLGSGSCRFCVCALKHPGNFSPHFASCLWEFLIYYESLNMKQKCSLRKITAVRCKKQTSAWKGKCSKLEGLAKLLRAAVATPPASAPSSVTRHKNFAKLQECLKGKKYLLRKHFMTVKCCMPIPFPCRNRTRVS